jgi:hypothetical protein
LELLLIFWDNAIAMMDTLLPILVGHCPPHRGVPHSKQDDQTLGMKDTVACTTATKKVADG